MTKKSMKLSARLSVSSTSDILLYFNHVGVLRLDLKSEYETSEEIFTIMNLIVPPTFDLFECEEIITKVPVYAVERIEA